MHLLMLHALLSGGQVTGVPVQTPLMHLSPVVQCASPSSHTEFSTLLANTQPLPLASHESVVQSFLSLQTTAVPLHVVSTHTSPTVHAFASSQPHGWSFLGPHVLGTGTAAVEQPVAGSQLSTVHGLPSSQLAGVLTHAPALQSALAAHLSSTPTHGESSAAGVALHKPLAVSHVAVWHASL